MKLFSYWKKPYLVCLTFSILVLSCKTAKESRQAFDEQKLLDREKIEAIVKPRLDAIYEKLQAFIAEKSEQSQAQAKLFSETTFFSKLQKFFPNHSDLLNEVRVVEVDELPHWGPPEKIGIDSTLLSSTGLDPEIFTFPGAMAMTFNKTIFVKKGNLDKEDMFFHELVHVAQYNILGEKEFLSRYLLDIFQGTSYEKIRLEDMAFTLEKYYKSTTFDVMTYVNEHKDDL